MFEGEEQLEIQVKSYKDKNKTILMAIWLVLFSACGVFALVALTEVKQHDQIIFWLVFISFWVYFEITITRALIWRIKGIEKLVLSKRGLMISKSIFGKENFKSFSIDDIEKIAKLEVKPTSLLAAYENAYWFVGGEKLIIILKSKKILFGAQLTEKEADDVLRKLKFFHQKLIKR